MNITKKYQKNTKNTQKRPKIEKRKRISRIIRERLQTSTKVEVCEYYELCIGQILCALSKNANFLQLAIFWAFWIIWMASNSKVFD